MEAWSIFGGTIRHYTEDSRNGTGPGRGKHTTAEGTILRDVGTEKLEENKTFVQGNGRKREESLKCAKGEG